MSVSPPAVLAALRNQAFPPGTPCFFCSTVPPSPAAPGCNDTQEMWRLKNPKDYSRVRSYETFDLALPRCARCKRVHERGKRWFNVVWTLGAVLSIPAIGLASGNWIMAIMLGLLVPLLPGYFVFKWLSQAPGVRSNGEGDYLERYPPIARHLQEGWGITNGRADANRQRHPLWRPD